MGASESRTQTTAALFFPTQRGGCVDGVCGWLFRSATCAPKQETKGLQKYVNERGVQ